MFEIEAVATYIFMNYPRAKIGDLTLGRIIMMIYLIDWKASLILGKQLSNSKWKVINSEPRLSDSSMDSLINLINIKKLSSQNITAKLLLSITPDQKKIIDFVIKKVVNKTDNGLTLLVNSTFPAITQDATDDVDLTSLATTYILEFPNLAKYATQIIPTYGN